MKKVEFKAFRVVGLNAKTQTSQSLGVFLVSLLPGSACTFQVESSMSWALGFRLSFLEGGLGFRVWGFRV